jgi:K+-sensing histidine kinase KdpD
MPEANALTLPILIDTIPAFIENIARAVSEITLHSNATVYNSLASEHGGERARLTAYKHEHLIREYQILRWVFMQTLYEENAPITSSELVIIHASIDEAIQKAANAFTLVHEKLRDQYMATLSHDMKNPLSTILMSADLMLRNPDASAMLKQANKIKQNATRMNKMIEDLLDVTSINTIGRLQLSLRCCEIKSLTEEVIEEIEGNFSTPIEILGENIQGYWDANYLKRAIENLVTNAYKYGKDQSTITIQIHAKFERMFWTIHNFGNPIPPEERECIFQVFRRANAAKEGSSKGWGLGLPLVRGVAEAHGGSVSMESSLETGTTFLIDIPQDARPYQNAPVLEI